MFQVHNYRCIIKTSDRKRDREIIGEERERKREGRFNVRLVELNIVSGKDGFKLYDNST